MRKGRRRSRSWYVRSVMTQVVRHPNNEDRRVRALARAGAWQVYKRVVRRPVTLDLPGSLTIRCHPDSTEGSNLIYFGVLHDPDEMRFLLRYLRPGDNFIDGGANIGVYSLLAAGIIGSTGRVDAFEPDSLAASRLRENIVMNGLSCVIFAHEVALAEHSGVARFRVGWDVSNRLLSPSEGHVRAVEVRTVRLEDALPADVDYALGKLDLEGGEVSALQGGERLLRTHNPPVWQLEVIDSQLHKAGAARRDLEELLADHGYQFSSYGALTGETAFSDQIGSTSGNVLAIARSRRGEVEARVRAAVKPRS